MIGALAIKNRRQQQLLKSKSTCSTNEPQPVEPLPPPPQPAKARHCTLIYIIAGCLLVSGFVIIMPGIVQVKVKYFVISGALMGTGLLIVILACCCSELCYGSGDHVEGGRAALDQMRKRMNLPPLPRTKSALKKESMKNKRSSMKRKESERRRAGEEASGDAAPVAVHSQHKDGGKGADDSAAAAGGNGNHLIPGSMTPDLLFLKSTPAADVGNGGVDDSPELGAGLTVPVAPAKGGFDQNHQSLQSSVSISDVDATAVSPTPSPPPPVPHCSSSSGLAGMNLHLDSVSSISSHSELPLVST